MPSMTLTDRFIASLKPAMRTTYFDNKVVGLGLRASPTGGRAWWFIYRLHGKPSQWLKLGSYPALSLVDARKLALDQRKKVDVDRSDPVAERKAKEVAKKAPPPTAFTFNDLAKLYLGFAKSTKKSWAGDRQKLDRYLVPAWGPMPVRDITRTRVHELLDTLASNGMTVGVNRVQALISRMFTIALDRNLVDAHPAARMIKRFAEQAGERTLTDDEIRTLWAGLDAHRGPAADAIRLRLLLGQRGAEINGMAWSDVDLDGATWDLAGAATKNKQPHTVALPPTALDIVRRRRDITPADEGRVFPGLRMQRADYRALGVIHEGRYRWGDLRRTMATGLAGLGFPETTIGRCLNHASSTVTQKHYNRHRYLTETRAALDAWDDEIGRIVSGRKRRKKVLAFIPA